VNLEDNPASKDLTGTAKTDAGEKKQNSTPHSTLRSNRFSLREFAAKKSHAQPDKSLLRVYSPRRVVGESFRSLAASRHSLSRVQSKSALETIRTAKNLS